MDLVLFEDAMRHIARIVRVIMNSGGHALLGKELTALPSFLPACLPSSLSSLIFLSHLPLPLPLPLLFLPPSLLLVNSTYQPCPVLSFLPTIAYHILI